METQTQTPGATTETKSKLQAVDFATLGNGLYSENVIVDGTADAFAFASPVDDGWYVAGLKRPSDPATPFIQYREPGVSSEGKPYGKSLIINFDEVIESHANPALSNDDLKGKPKRFDNNVSTFVVEREGKPTSEAITFLTYLGATIPPGTTIDIEKVAQALGNAIDTGTAKILVRTQWKGGWIKGVKGQSRGKWSISGQSNFPLAPGGVTGKGPYNSTIVVNGEETHAMAKVVERAPLPEVKARMDAARAAALAGATR
jgi:hypothetical protein